MSLCFCFFPSLHGPYCLPPAEAEEVIFLIASMCLCVRLFVLCMLNQWTYPGGGTHPQKVWVGSAGAGKMKLYLYKYVKKGGLFYIFSAKNWIYSIHF